MCDVREKFAGEGIFPPKQFSFYLVCLCINLEDHSESILSLPPHPKTESERSSIAMTTDKNIYCHAGFTLRKKRHNSSSWLVMVSN